MATVKRWRQILETPPIQWPGGIGTIAVKTGPFTLEYSVDGGATWLQAGIDVGVGAAADTSFNFELPGKCLIRAATGGSGHVGDVMDSRPHSMEVVDEVEV